MVNFKNLIEALNDSITIANESLLSNHNEFIDTYFEKAENGGLVAKTVTLNFPVKMGDNTIKEVPVNAPVITLIPVYSPKVEEVKLTASLEIALDNDELMVSFSNDEKSSNLFGNKSKTSTAKLEIILKPGETTEGMKDIIEGYEKVLRAQIPG